MPRFMKPIHAVQWTGQSDLEIRTTADQGSDDGDYTTVSTGGWIVEEETANGFVISVFTDDQFRALYQVPTDAAISKQESAR